MTTMDSHYKFPASRLKTDQFFLHWLAQPENQELVWQLVEDCKAGRPLKGPTTTPTSSRATPRSPRLSSPPSTAFSPTPSSPSKAQLPASPQASPSAKVTPPVTTATTAELPDAVPEPGIPRFFHPKTAASSEQVAAFNVTVRAAFHQHGGAVTANQLHTVLPDVCNCPGYLAFEVFRKAVAGPAQERISGEQFVSWWRKEGLVGADSDTCVFQVLRQPGTEYLTQGDLTQFMQHVLQHHPGLEFLQETAEFQEHYAHTVVFRILYTLDRTEKGVLTLADVKRGSLAQAMMQLDREEDINKVLRFFSYEHFYVMYCKFWELDQDHDFMIDRDDLLRYGQHGLTYRIVDRIFQQAPRRFACQTPGKMGYEDFVYFILSEEDKTTDASLKYWHRCADLDDDGIVTTEDMRFFYEEQLHRMESASQAPVTFNDIMCQMQDMLSPATPGHFSLRDLRKTRQLAGTLFNILFNISKFVAYETRDPFLIRQEKTDDPDATEWDRFARQEYIRLALEEETADDSQMDTDGVWEPQEAAALLDIGGGMQARDGMDSSHSSGGSSPLVTPSFLS